MSALTTISSHCGPPLWNNTAELLNEPAVSYLAIDDCNRIAIITPTKPALIFLHGYYKLVSGKHKRLNCHCLDKLKKKKKNPSKTFNSLNHKVRVFSSSLYLGVPSIFLPPTVFSIVGSARAKQPCGETIRRRMRLKVVTLFVPGASLRDTFAGSLQIRQRRCRVLHFDCFIGCRVPKKAIVE